MRVRIYRRAKSAAQSGRALTQMWVIEAENATPRIPDPIMGWASAEDPFTMLRDFMRFPSYESAILFAGKKGWDVVVISQPERQLEPRNYLDNFRYFGPDGVERAAFP